MKRAKLQAIAAAIAFASVSFTSEAFAGVSIYVGPGGYYGGYYPYYGYGYYPGYAYTYPYYGYGYYPGYAYGYGPYWRHWRRHWRRWH
jgi:hypothetical protein